MTDDARKRSNANLMGPRFVKGRSGNPGGPPKLKNDLKRAALIGVPPEVTATLEEWFEDASARLAELGAESFIAALRAALDEATKRVLPVDPAEARAMWWRTILPVVFSGPSGSKDSVWTYASGEVGNRLLGKPKEHVVLEDGNAPPIDWTRVPAERREFLQAAIAELLAYVTEPESATEH